MQALTSSGSRSVQLEDPLLSELYHTLVIKGDWVATESLLERIAYNIDKISTPYAPNTLFGRGARDSPPNLHWNSTLKHSIERAYRPPWPALVPPDPPARRAQATAYDARNRVIYMHGGWDGIQDLADFWAYDVRAREWTMISPDTSQVLMSRVVPGEGIKPSFEPPIPGLPPSRLGPSPRRGHAMAFDDRSGMLYLYGRFYEPDPNVAARFAPPHSSGTNAGQSLERTAQFIDRLRSSAGTHQSPRNAHNLLMMESADDADDAGAEYRPDLWAFDTRSRRWVCMSTDVRAQGGPCLLYDHKMIVDPRRQQLYIFGGQEVKESSVLDRNDPMNFWSGMWCFDLVSNTWSRSRDDPWLFPRTQNALLLGPPPGSGDGWDYSSSEQQPNHLWIIGGFDSRYTNDISTWNPTTHTFTPVPVRADARFGAFEGRPHLSSHPCASFDHEGTLWVWTSPSQRETPDLLENVPFGPAVRNELWRLDNTTLTWFRIWASDSVSSVSDGSVVPNPNETTAERASKRRGLNPTFGGLLRCHDWHPARPSHHEILTDVYPSGLFFDTYPPSWFFHGQADPSSHTRQHKEDEQPATFPTPKVGTEGLDGDELDELGLDLGLRSCDDWSTTPSPCGLSSSGSKTAGCMPIRIAPHFFCVSGGSGMPEMVFVGGVDPLPSNPHHTSQTASAWGDTWHLELRFPHWHDHLQRAHVLVRQQQFAEMLFDAGASVALGFLQSSLAEVLDYSSEHDTRLLRSLTSQLLDPPPTPSTSDSSRSQGRFTSKGDSCNSNGHWDDRLVTRQDRTMDDGVGSHVSRSPSSTSPRTATSDESWRARQLKVRNQRIRVFRALLPMFPLQATEPRQELVHSITH